MQNDVLHENMPVSPLIRQLQLDQEFLETIKTPSYGHIYQVGLVIQKGANVNAIDEENQTALHIAAREGYTWMCKFLIEEGANVDARDKDNKTPLMLSARSEKAQTCALLISKGANVNAIDKSGKTALGYAKASHSYDAARIIIWWGILSNLLRDGFTAFNASFAECIATEPFEKSLYRFRSSLSGGAQYYV
jgi:ankyrin repeat protein